MKEHPGVPAPHGADAIRPAMQSGILDVTRLSAPGKYAKKQIGFWRSYFGSESTLGLVKWSHGARTCSAAVAGVRVPSASARRSWTRESIPESRPASGGLAVNHWTQLTLTRRGEALFDDNAQHRDLGGSLCSIAVSDRTPPPMPTRPSKSYVGGRSSVGSGTSCRARRRG